jgi:hypothetical protein
MADFPANVSTGRIHGTVLSWLVDSADAGVIPDVEPFATATVKFTPSVKYVLHPSTGAIIVPVPSPITISVAGEIDVTLVATDDPDINPTGWTYKMEITVIGGTIPSQNISVPSGSDRLLTELVAVAESSGTYTTMGLPGKSAYELAVMNGYVGTQAQWLAQWVSSDGTITRVRAITQAAYNALTPPDPTTLYVITS